MDDQNNSGHPANTPDENAPVPSPPQPAVPPREIPTDAEDRPKQDKSTARELAREFRWFEILSLIVNGVLAVVGIFALVIYHGQLKVMQGQLDQMKSGSAQTDKFVAATNNLADSTKRQTDVIVDVLQGTQHATVAFYVGGKVNDTTTIEITGVNSGHLTANHAIVDVSMQRVSVPDRNPIGRPYTGCQMDTSIPPMQPDGNPAQVFYPCEIPTSIRIKPKDRFPLNQTIELRWETSFDNGYDTLIKTRSDGNTVNCKFYDFDVVPVNNTAEIATGFNLNSCENFATVIPRAMEQKQRVIEQKQRAEDESSKNKKQP
jgi:hypothetical protein